jgi:hypothetical protein
MLARRAHAACISADRTVTAAGNGRLGADQLASRLGAVPLQLGMHVCAALVAKLADAVHAQASPSRGKYRPGCSCASYAVP